MTKKNKPSKNHPVLSLKWSVLTTQDRTINELSYLRRPGIRKVGLHDVISHE
jgi:hypothetical protein